MEATISKGDLKVNISNRQVFSIALPISLAILIPQLNYVTNNIFLGELGKEALGDAGITGVYYLVMAVAGNGFNNALQSLISKSGGEGNIDKISTLVQQGLRIALQFAVAGILFTWFVAPFILKPFLNPASYNAEINFLKIRVFGLPFLFLFQLGNAFLVGTLNSRYLMIGFVFEALVNIFFDYTLIMGRLGFPHMGFNGAAVASMISEFAGLLMVIFVIGRLKLHKRFGLLKKYSYQRTESKEILKISAPLVMQYVISLATWLIFFIMIESNYNQDDKAISNIMRNVFGIAGVFIWAFASTTNVMISNLVGQGRQHEVFHAIKKIMTLSFCAALLMGTLINVFPYTFFGLFGQGEEFVQRGIPVLRVTSTALLIMSIALVWLNSLTGTGQTRINLAVEIVAVIGYLLHCYIVIRVLKLELLWAWSNEWVYWIIIFSISFFWMNRKQWKSE